MSDVDGAIKRAEQKHNNLGIAFDDLAILAAEVKRLREFTPPDGWVQFGTHANCRPRAQIEMSTEVGEDGLPLWERPVTRPVHHWGEETL